MKKLLLLLALSLIPLMNFAQCDLEASFEYEVIDGTYYFTNTSTEAGEEPTFEWYVDDILWSDEENPTLGGGDVEPGSVICLVVTTADGECVDEYCIEVEPCEIEASFEYELDGDLYYFFNTSTGAGDDPTFEWYVDDILWSDEENPTLGAGDVEPGSVICLVITSADGECVDEYCIEIEPCEIEASFEYELDGDLYYFFNTSTGAGDDPTFEWYVDDILWSDEENPTLGAGDVEPGSVICLVITSADGECVDEYCVEVEGEPCELEVSFDYVILDGTIYFTNTSTGEGDASVYNWTLLGSTWSDDENPTLPLDEVEEGDLICLIIYDEVTDCEGDHCIEIEIGEEPPCETIVDFTMDVEAEAVYFENASIDMPELPVYKWYDDGVLFSEEENPVIPLANIGAESDICLEIISETDECSVSSCKEFYSETELSLAEHNENVFSLYPNPVHNELVIQVAADLEIKQVKIYNAVGEIAAVISLTDSQQTVLVDMSSFESGIYFIQILDTSGTYTTPQQVVRF